MRGVYPGGGIRAEICIFQDQRWRSRASETLCEVKAEEKVAGQVKFNEYLGREEDKEREQVDAEKSYYLFIFYLIYIKAVRYIEIVDLLHS
jgi:hypothetical protein